MKHMGAVEALSSQRKGTSDIKRDVSLHGMSDSLLRYQHHVVGSGYAGDRQIKVHICRVELCVLDL